MGYQTATRADVESVLDETDGGMWFLKDALGTDHLGFTLLELEPGSDGMEHDHAEEGQEEVYYVVAGEIRVEFDDGSVTLAAGEALRIDAAETRRMENRGDERAELVLAGAPR